MEPSRPSRGREGAAGVGTPTRPASGPSDAPAPSASAVLSLNGAKVRFHDQIERRSTPGNPPVTREFVTMARRQSPPNGEESPLVSRGLFRRQASVRQRAVLCRRPSKQPRRGRGPFRRGAATLGAASPTQTCLRCRTGISSSTPRALLRADRRARRRCPWLSAHTNPPIRAAEPGCYYVKRLHAEWIRIPRLS